MDDLNSCPKCKVVLIGDQAVGKTSIVARLVKESFSPNEQPTVGAAFVQHTFNYNGKRMEMQIWDTAGQEKYASIGPIYYRRANVALIVFDVNEEESFNNVRHWIKRFREEVGGNTPIRIIGNKIDIISNQRINSDLIARFTNEEGLEISFTSARTGEGIKEVFNDVVKIVEQQILDSKSETQALTEPKANKGKKSCCG